jgi:hypothetical protein
VLDSNFAAFTLQVKVSAIVASRSKTTNEKAPEGKTKESENRASVSLPKITQIHADIPLRTGFPRNVHAQFVITVRNGLGLVYFAHFVTIVKR